MIIQLTKKCLQTSGSRSYAIKDHFWQNICDLICEKGPPVETLQKQFCIHTVAMNSCAYIAAVILCIYKTVFEMF